MELPPTSGTGAYSRYQTDFVELGPLGRGGGGEVVKAINRLDRRIYAIKRIVLESEEEEGKDLSKRSKIKNQRAVIQNQKLRREVTTISRMTHKNIVRYYQAWVESKQQEQQEGKVDSALEQTVLEGHVKSDNKESSGYSWSSSSYSSSDSSTSSSSSDEQIETLKRTSQQQMEYVRSLSLDNFLEHEMNDFSNPFLFQDHPRAAASSNIESDSDALEVERGQSLDSLRKTLYIQMEYCKTTMRDMIDECKLTTDMVWKFLRQILEALAYIHGNNIIHRYVLDRYSLLHCITLLTSFLTSRDLKPANIFVDSEGEIKLVSIVILT